MATVSPRRIRIAHALDTLFFVLLITAVVVDVTGGVRIGRGWYRISATDPAHTALLAAGVLLLRHVIVPWPSIRTRLTERRARRGAADAALVLTPPTAREWLIALGVMAAATGWVMQDQLRVITGVPDRGDPFFSMWRIGWVAKHFMSPSALWNANIFYPAPNTFAYSDATLLPGLLAAPLLWMGIPLAAVHGLLYVGSFFAAGLTMFLLVRAVTGRLDAGLFAGILFAFYPYRFSTFSHLEMQGLFLMPLAVYFLLRTLDAGRMRDGVALGLTLTAEALWSLYLGAYLAVGLAVILAVRWLAGHFTWRSRLKALGAGALLTLAILVPYSRPYWTARDIVGDRPRDEARTFSAIPSDYLHINEVNDLYGRVLHKSMTSERQLFPGGSAAVFAIVGLVPPFTPMTAMSAVGAVVAFDASLGLNGAVFTWLYELSSSFRAFRVPARFGTLAGVFITLLAGLGMARAMRRVPGRAAGVVATGLIAFAVFELKPSYELMPTPTTMPAVYDALPDSGDAIIVDIPLPTHDGEYWIDPTYLYYSTFHGRRMLNGFSGFFPVWYPRLVVASREFPSDDSIAVFKKAGAQFAVVHEEFYGNRWQEIVDAMDKRQDLELLAARPSVAGEKRLYRLR